VFEIETNEIKNKSPHWFGPHHDKLITQNINQNDKEDELFLSVTFVKNHRIYHNHKVVVIRGKRYLISAKPQAVVRAFSC